MNSYIKHDYNLEQYYKYCTKVQIKKGEYIVQAREVSDTTSAYFLDSGLCALTSVTPNGEEIIYLYFHALRIIGFSHLMPGIFSRDLHINDNIFSIVAKTDCTLYRLSSSSFYQLINENHQFSNFMLKVLSENYVEVLNRFHQIQEESACARLCHLLLDQYIELDGQKLLPSYFTYSEISKYLGTHSVTVARIMAKLKAKNLISKNGHCVSIEDESGLLELIANNGELEY